jgi:polysaccharide export outer membrane protein
MRGIILRTCKWMVMARVADAAVIACFLSFLVLFAGCVTPSSGNADGAPMDGDGEAVATLEPYRLGAGDEIVVQVYREAEFSGTFKIDQAGLIRHPLFGSLKMAELTVPDAEHALTALLAERFLVNPRVSISVASVRSEHVVILGEVQNPGVHPMPFGEKMTLLQAIASAGGFTELASPARVTLQRQGAEQESVKVNVSRLISGRDPDIVLRADDVIMVPKIRF